VAIRGSDATKITLDDDYTRRPGSQAKKISIACAKNRFAWLDAGSMADCDHSTGLGL
jgi:hypothetical protein